RGGLAVEFSRLNENGTMQNHKAIIINEDANHYYITRGAAGATPEALRDLSARYCRGMVGEVFYNVNAQKCSVDGFSLDPIWRGVEKRDDGYYFNGRKQSYSWLGPWFDCAFGLHRLGIDPYAVWLAETRRLGRKGFISIRMNDTHCVDDLDCPLLGELWLNHLEWRLDTTGLPGWNAQALDYARPEVRNLYLTFTKEVLEHYDCDGVELDWMRFGHQFQTKDTSAGRAILTDFHRDVRKAADAAATRLSHRVDVYARVPSSPTEAFAMGYDVKRWADEGLVQGVIVAPFDYVDTDMPIAFWRSFLGPDVVLCACLELNIEPYSGADSIRQDFALLAGQAAAYLQQGADRIYLFNMMDTGCIEDPAQYNRALDTLGSLEAAAAAHRRHVATYQDIWAFGHNNSSPSCMHGLLPACLHPFEFFRIRLATGPKPSADRKCRLVIGGDAGKIASMKAWLNNVPLEPTGTFENGPGLDEPYSKCASVFATFDCTDKVADGDNLVVLQNVDRGRELNIRWAEIEIF
ncbi:MAG: hypothetical protein J6Y80_01245, partial [Victivallales bacterium]|nr:hypothetical protein [Victivallales bacterium]